MKNIGITAMVVGIVLIILGFVGVLGQEGPLRTVMVGALILLVGGFFLYRRGKIGRAM